MTRPPTRSTVAGRMKGDKVGQMGGLRCTMQRLESPKWHPVQRRNQMKLIAFPLVGVATLAGVVSFTAPAANQEGVSMFDQYSSWIPRLEANLRGT